MEATPANTTFTTDNGLFEGLFVRALDVTGPLEGELRRLGYDRRHPEARYPTAVFLACVDATRQALHPTQQRDAGLRLLGTAFFTGFRQTILGRVFIGAIGVVGPKRLLGRIPRQLQSARGGVKCRVVELGPTSYDLVLEDPAPLGPFFAGAVTAVLEAAGAHGVTVTVLPKPGGYDLQARW